jgi:integration host factor subunit beta
VVSNNKLTKAEIVETLIEKTGFDKKEILLIVDTIFEEIRAALSEDKIVELRGFGTFEIRTRKGRSKARNPRTGELIQVHDHGVTIFRAGKELKESARALRR